MTVLRSLIRPLLRPLIRGILDPRLGSSGAPFISIANLFLTKSGAWYEPSDLSTMWQDAAGTTPAVVDSPVGKINDKSGNGFHLTQPVGASCPILRNSGAVYWLEFDGLDDVMSGTAGAYSGVGATHYVAAGLNKGAQTNNTHLFGAQVSGTIQSRIDNVSTLNRAGARYRNASVIATVSSSSGQSTVGVTTVIDTLQTPGYIDMSINSAMTLGTSASVSTDTLGAATVIIGNAITPLNFYNGLMLIGIPSTAQRTGIQQYQAGKSGITF